MTREKAERLMMEHFKEIIKIAKKHDPNANYLNLAAFISDGYMSVTNGKDLGDPKRLNCYYLSAEQKKMISAKCAIMKEPQVMPTLTRGFFAFLKNVLY